MKVLLSVLLAIFILAFPPVAIAANYDPIGVVKNVSGDVYIKQAVNTVKAVPLMKLHQGDTIITAKKSSAGLIFVDDTVVSLGPDSEFAIDSFLFNPVEKELSFIARMIKGTFSLISGRIVRLAPDKVQFRTPDATLGVRGTKILVQVDPPLWQ